MNVTPQLHRLTKRLSGLKGGSALKTVRDPGVLLPPHSLRVTIKLFIVFIAFIFRVAPHCRLYLAEDLNSKLLLHWNEVYE